MKQSSLEEDEARLARIKTVSLAGPHYGLAFAPTEDMIVTIMERKHGSYASQGAELDDRFGQTHFFLESEVPKSKTKWYGFTQMPVLYPYRKKTKRPSFFVSRHRIVKHV